MSTASTTSVAADLADYFQRIGPPVPEGADLPDADMSTLSRVVLDMRSRSRSRTSTRSLAAR